MITDQRLIALSQPGARRPTPAELRALLDELRALRGLKADREVMPASQLVARGIRKPKKTPQLRATEAVFADARKVVMDRDGHSCVRCGHRASQVHHRIPRGMGGTRNPNAHELSRLISVCDDCHLWIESNRSEAEGLGYLVRFGTPPAYAPILWRTRWVHLGSDGAVYAVPTPPEQAKEMKA